ncbi:unnamed protein product [Trichobilharzia szidati]|nr:unnamed protein product [Trichobilharzia szidati]
MRRAMTNDTVKNDSGSVAEKPFYEYDKQLSLMKYADSYRDVLSYKFLMAEIQTYENPQNGEETIRREILRLEHLYQSKWAKEFLELVGAKDLKLVNFSTDEYRKAFEEDIAFQLNVFAHEGLHNVVKKSISSKWENRKYLDIVEALYFAETSINLKRNEVQIGMIEKDLMEAKKEMEKFRAELQVLETAAVAATNVYRNKASSLDDTEITEAYWKARTDLVVATRELVEKIEPLEMKRIAYLKSVLLNFVSAAEK